MPPLPEGSVGPSRSTCVAGRVAGVRSGGVAVWRARLPPAPWYVSAQGGNVFFNRRTRDPARAQADRRAHTHRCARRPRASASPCASLTGAATAGACGRGPSALKVAVHKKWQAWRDCASLTPEQAMEAYNSRRHRRRRRAAACPPAHPPTPRTARPFLPRPPPPPLATRSCRRRPRAPRRALAARAEGARSLEKPKCRRLQV